MKDLSKKTYWVDADLADDSFRRKVYFDLIELPGGTHLPVPIALVM